MSRQKPTAAVGLAFLLRPLVLALNLTVAGLAMAIAIQTVTVVILTHNSLPQEDEWYSLKLFERVLASGNLLQALFSQHNEHRIMFPRLILFSDYLFFAGRGVLNLITIFVIQGLEAALLIYMLWRARLQGKGSIAVGSMAVLLLFSLRQSENFTWGFQVSFVGVFACASLAVVLFVTSLAPGPDGGRTVLARAAAYILAGVASFSMANGLVCPVILVLLAVLARASLRVIAVTALVAVGLIWVFEQGYVLAADGEGVTGWMSHPVRLAIYTAAYLGNFADPALDDAAFIGGCGLLATLAILLRFASGADRDPIRLALLGITLFAAGSALLTALGRSADGLGGAMSNRYATGAALFWAAILINGWCLSGATRQPAAIRLLVASAMAVLIAASIRLQGPTIAMVESRSQSIGALEDGLIQDLFDGPALEAMSDPVDMVRAFLPFLRDRGLSIFAERGAKLVGHSLADVGRVEPRACSGSFASATAAPAIGQDGARVAGTSSVARRWRVSTRIYIADRDHRVVGLASTGFGSGEWIGYATAAPGSALEAYAAFGSHRLCAIGAAIVAAEDRQGADASPAAAAP